LQGYRDTVSDPVPIAARVNERNAYFVCITPNGSYANTIQLSADGVNWIAGGAPLSLQMIGTVNTMFYSKATIGPDDPFGETVHTFDVSYRVPL
jgi:hypothetical protein